MCPERVFRHAELYFFSRFHTFIVLSALPDMSVVAFFVEDRQRTSFMCPDRLLVLVPELSLFYLSRGPTA